MSRTVPVTAAARKRGISIRCSVKIRRSLVLTLCMLSPLLHAAQEPTASNWVTYLSFEVPGALGTFPMSINVSMAVTGYYYVSSKVTRGFVRDAEGAITTFDVSSGVWTEPESINADGEIAGFYEVAPGVPHGFFRYADGRIITFDPPANLPTGPQALPVSINAFGEVAGNDPDVDGPSNGFTRSLAGQFTTFDYAQGALYPTVVTGLNDSGTVVGYFAVDSNISSFTRNPDGVSTEFVVPVDVANNGILKTAAQSINEDGVIGGWYFALTSRQPGVISTTGGFVRSPQGIFTLFSPPGTIVTAPGLDFIGGTLSVPHRLSINQEGSIAGSYTDAEGAQHGFVRNPYGTITSFDPPRGGQTTATCINDNGVIAGSYFYTWNTQIPQGFLRLPKP